jgi:hypothetical protein
MKLHWQFTTSKVCLLYASCTAVGIEVGSMMTAGRLQFGPLLSCLSMALISVSVVLGAYRKNAPAQPSSQSVKPS